MSVRTDRARRLRQTSGLAEDRVWSLLRGGKIDSHKFRRQHPIGRFTVDFACDRLRLILEIDGGVHRLETVAARDLDRQKEIEALGWTVMRFPNDVAIGRPDQIIAAIRAHAASLSPWERA